MQRTEAEKLAGDFLSAESGDESWIDASSGYARSKLADLLVRVYKMGVDTTKRETEAAAACRALGAFPSAFDE
jgi:hypothetical protein